MKNINISFEENSVSIKSVFFSVILAYCLSLILLAIFAVILTYTNFPETSIPTVVLIVTIISIIYASQSAAKKAKSRGWFVGAITGLIYMLILYIISLIFTQRAVFDAHLFLIFLMSLFSGAVGGIIGINIKKPEKRR